MAPQTTKIQVTVAVAPAPPPPLEATPATVTLPDETAGEPAPLTQIAQVSGGTPPYTYQTAGNFPAGMSLSEDGNGNVSISGTPTTPGSYSFEIDVTDSGQ